MNDEFMMIFGCGDLVIMDQCNFMDQSVSRLGTEFDVAPANRGEEGVTATNPMQLGGQFKFTIQEIEVYKINIANARQPQGQ